MLNNSTQRTFWQTFKTSITGLLTILPLVFFFVTLAYLTMAKCATNCSLHTNFSQSCLSEGSLYCCREPTGSYAQYSCGGYQECELDNEECGRYMAGSGVVGGTLLLVVAYMMYRAICPTIPVKEETQQPSSSQRRLTAHLITNKDEHKTTISERSSNDRPPNFHDRRQILL